METIHSVDLETSRTKIREMAPSDLDALFQLTNDPDVTRYVRWPLRTREELQSFIFNLNDRKIKTPRTAYLLTVEDRETGDTLGFLKILITSTEDEQVEVGGYLLKTHWGKGLAKEVTRAILDFGFRQLVLRRIFAYCDPQNTASVQVLEKLGFFREGTLRSHFKLPDGWRDSHVYALISSDLNYRV